MAVATIHEARFVLFDDDKQLAFITSFDGPWDAYMEDFFTSGPTLALFDVIFRHVEGYEGLPAPCTLTGSRASARSTTTASRPSRTPTTEGCTASPTTYREETEPWP